MDDDERDQLKFDFSNSVDYEREHQRNEWHLRVAASCLGIGLVFLLLIILFTGR